MRPAMLLLLPLLAACAPPAPPPMARYTPPPGPYVPPYPDLAPRAAPQPAAIPGDTEEERSYYLRRVAVLQSFRCRTLGRDEAVRLMVALEMDRTRLASVSDARRETLHTLARTRTRQDIADDAPCPPAATRLTRALQDIYPPPRTRPAQPRPAPPGTTGPADSGWQPARPAPAPLRPDQLDL